jgi:prepilin-type processing-associated H-X9-DG protein
LSYAYNFWLVASKAVNASPAQVPYTTSTVLLFEVADSNADIRSYDEGATRGAKTFSASGYAGVLFSGPEGLGQRDGPKFATGPMVGQSGQASVILDSRHRGGSNFCLVDGHVKWLRPKQVASGENRMTDEQRDKLTAYFMDENYKKSP